MGASQRCKLLLAPTLVPPAAAPELAVPALPVVMPACALAIVKPKTAAKATGRKSEEIKVMVFPKYQ
jgi:hypothetical protein